MVDCTCDGCYAVFLRHARDAPLRLILEPLRCAQTAREFSRVGLQTPETIQPISEPPEQNERHQRLRTKADRESHEDQEEAKPGAAGGAA